MSHFIGFLPYESMMINNLSNTPLHIFWDGQAAVDLFFVLSGFCIAIPYVRAHNRRSMSYGAFLIRRFFRLYPAYIFTIILCFLLKQYYHSPGTDYISAWGDDFWQWNTLSPMQIINVISLIGSFDPDWLDPPTWSLIVEMRMAFLLPILIFIVNRYTACGNVKIFLGLMIASIIEPLGVGKIFTFAYLFYLGIVMAWGLPKICDFINKLKKTTLCSGLLLGGATV